jgi:uridylate kinase
LKATKVDGVYSSDPELDSNAVKYDNLSYDEVIEKKLGVMDLTAICLSRDHQVPIKVFNMNTPGALLNNVMGKPDGTHIA